MAESIVNTLTQTDYQHVDNIDPSTGVYDCDCNGFAAFILRAVALQNFEEIPIDTQVGSVESRPRAFEYYGFFASLTPQSAGGWSRVICSPTPVAATLWHGDPRPSRRMSTQAMS
jgi:hypothetical protein